MSTAWDKLMSTIKPLDTTTLKTLPGFSTPAPAQTSAAGLNEHQSHTRRPRRRRTFDARHVSNIAKAVSALPSEGESQHIVMKGNSPLFLLLPRILELAAPATISQLYISTLGFSLTFAELLLSLLDSKRIGAVGIAVSTYFRATSENEFDFLAAGLEARGQTIRVCRTHAKVIAMAMSDGTGYTLEGSGNLRSCRMAEQLVITRDAELARFHQTWIADMLRRAS